MREVTVICLAYNQEKYIHQCLESLVNQETSFEYKIIVHDDCSNDFTKQIIEQYTLKYPDLIKPIYETMNIYSSGGLYHMIHDCILPEVEGKYIAFCEGDDRWCSTKKLQTQYEYMETHPECSMCVHNAQYIDNINKTNRIFPNVLSDTDFSLDEIVSYGGSIFATNSIFAKKDVFFSLPTCFSENTFLDYQWFMYAALLGKVTCLTSVMSVYVSGAEGSFTDNTWKDVYKRISHFGQVIQMLGKVDEYYSFKYHEIISKKIIALNYQICMLSGDYRELRKPAYRSMIQKKGIKNILKIYISAYLPCLPKLKRKLYATIKEINRK